MAKLLGHDGFARSVGHLCEGAVLPTGYYMVIDSRDPMSNMLPSHANLIAEVETGARGSYGSYQIRIFEINPGVKITPETLDVVIEQVANPQVVGNVNVSEYDSRVARKLPHWLEYFLSHFPPKT